MNDLLNSTNPRASQHPSLKSAAVRLRFLSAGDRRLILHAQRRLDVKRLHRGIVPTQQQEGQGA